MATYDIATIEGDGIGPEVCAATVTVLKEALGANKLSFNQFPGGASHYVKTGQSCHKKLLMPAIRRTRCCMVPQACQV